MVSATAFDMPETISGESPATVPFKKPEPEQPKQLEQSKQPDKSTEVLAITPDVPTQATDATTAADSHDEKFWRELEIMAELRTAEIKRQEASTAFDIKTEERKEAKEYLASCTAALARVTAKLVGLSTLPEPKKETQVGQGGSVEPPVAQSEPQDLAKPNISQPTITEPEPSNVGQGGQDNSWRIEPTANIIEGLPGLGSKKFDAIVELCPTVGDLEDKRAEAAKDFLPFKAALPKGCGESIANAIEDALLAYIGRFGQQVKAAKSEPDPAEPPKVDDDLADL